MIRVMTECKMTQSALATALVLTSRSSSQFSAALRFRAVPAGRRTLCEPANFDKSYKAVNPPTQGPSQTLTVFYIQRRDFSRFCKLNDEIGHLSLPSKMSFAYESFTYECFMTLLTYWQGYIFCQCLPLHI